jgi:hypothetical protein
MGQRSEPVDSPLVLSQTKYNWSLAAVEVNVGSTTYDMVAQCGAGDQLKSDLSVHIRGCSIVRRRVKGLSRLVYLCYYLKQSIIGH